MNTQLELLRYAWRNILRNRRRSLATVIVAALGAAAVMIAGGFALYTYDSLREGSAREFGHFSVAHRDFFQRDEETPLQYGLTDYRALIAALEKDPRVTRVLPRLNFSGLISNGDKSLVFMGLGADARGEGAARGVFLKLAEGELFGGAEPGAPRVVLGAALAKSLKARPGAALTLLAATSEGSMNAIDVEVAGVVTTGWPEIDKRLVYAPLAAVQKLLATAKVSTLAVYLDDTESTSAALGEWRARDAGHEFKPWWEQAFYYASVRALYNRIFGLLGIIIAVLVFFSVANTLSMAVVERTREIGTLRALGALPGEIVAQFAREGALIGALGALIGMALAALVTLALLGMDLQMPPPPGRSEGYPLKVYADPAIYAATAALIATLCVAAAWFVSRKAAAKPIVEALGHV
ncbi:MAG: ABC transporter permease [Sulfuricella sp.]|nr:ABC transporter permease [Sulfuricella sp.]